MCIYIEGVGVGGREGERRKERSEGKPGRKYGKILRINIPRERYMYFHCTLLTILLYV